MDERVKRATELYERAVFHDEPAGLEIADGELDAVAADLAMARGKVLHARMLNGAGEDPRELPLFEQAAALYRERGDTRGEAEALCWIGIYHQVIRHDDAVAVPALERSRALAAAAGDDLTRSYALRHLGIAEHVAGRLAGARERLDESTRLRRKVGFPAGVAANQVGLAYLAAAEGRRADALAILDEARATAESCGARRILQQVEEARATL